MIFCYKCICGATFQAELSAEDRYKVHCPCCGGSGEAPSEFRIAETVRTYGEDGGMLTIILQPVRWGMKHYDRIITEAQLVSEKGPNWRETPGSRRMLVDEPERTYYGTHDGPGRRRGKSYLNHSPATDSPAVQAERESKMVKDRLGSKV